MILSSKPLSKLPLRSRGVAKSISPNSPFNFFFVVSFLEFFDPHSGDEFDAETDEILWWLAVDISYRYGGVEWTVPGR
jgi:hypothetical protein